MYKNYVAGYGMTGISQRTLQIPGPAHLRRSAYVGILAAGICLHAVPALAMQASELFTGSISNLQPKDDRRAARRSDYAFAFAQADVADIVNEVLGQTLRYQFAMDPTVSGKVSFEYRGPRSPERLLRALESALALTDVVLVPNGREFLVTTRAKAKGSAEITSARAALEPGFHIISVPVNHMPAQEAGKAVEAVGPPGIVLHADDSARLIVLDGTSSELRRALATLGALDRGHEQVGATQMVLLKAASATALSAELERILTATGPAGVNVVPIPRLNALIVNARDPEALSPVMGWIANLDVPSHDEKTALWLYHPQNISVDSLNEALNQLFSTSKTTSSSSFGGGASTSPSLRADPTLPAATESLLPPPASPTGGSTEEFHSIGSNPLGQDVRIGLEKQTNTLLVMAPEGRWLPLRAVLERLDHAPEQILIEATVLEVTLNDAFQFGVDFSVLGSKGRLNATSTQDAAGAVAAAYPGLAVSYLSNSVKAVIDTIATKTKVRVVSSPKLLTLDNRAATLDVGQEVPIVDQSAQSTITSTASIVENTEYKDTGIILKITPRINGENSIYLDFSQEVSSVEANTTSTINSPVIQQRKFQTAMSVHGGQTVALGGLISSNDSRSVSGIPYLQDLPAVGALFRTTNHTLTKTEIIVLLTATIIKDKTDEDSSTHMLQSEMKSLSTDDREKTDKTPAH